MTIGALLFLVAVAWLAGKSWDVAAGSWLGREARWVMDFIAGLVSIFVILLVFHALGVPWGSWILVPALVVLAILGGYRSRQAVAPRSPSLALGWGDGVAGLAFLVFCVCTALAWNLHPDFIYHWGIKGAKFHLASGLDLEYLASPWNAHIHPDYPNLLPVLFGASASLAGRFDAVSMALWSIFFYLATLCMGRQLLRQIVATEFARHAGLGILALALTMFGVGYQTAGGADWLTTLSVMTAAVFLTRRPDASHDLSIGLIAAFSAAAKIEGIPLAAFLIAVHLFRRWTAGGLRTGGRWWRCLGRVVVPAAVVGGFWAWPVYSLGLFQSDNTGAFDGQRAAVVLPELWRSLGTVNWHGLTFVLVAVPVLLVIRRTRWIAAVIVLQLAFYVYVYMSAPVDPREYVVTSAARLFFHVVPPVLVLSIAAADRWSATVSMPTKVADGHPTSD